MDNEKWKTVRTTPSKTVDIEVKQNCIPTVRGILEVYTYLPHGSPIAIYHNHEGLARVLRDNSGKVVWEQYFLHGDEYTKEQWIKMVSRLGGKLF